MDIHGTSVIAGTPAETAGATFRAFDPALGIEIAPDFHEASPADVDAAMRAAAKAFADYRARSAEERASFLDAIAAEIESLGDALVARATAETGLPAARIQAERARTCGQLRLFAEVVREGSWVDARIDTALPDRQPLPRPDLRRMLLPLVRSWSSGRAIFPSPFPRPAATPRRPWPPGVRSSSRRIARIRAPRAGRRRHRPRGAALWPARRRLLADSRGRRHGRRRDGPARRRGRGGFHRIACGRPGAVRRRGRAAAPDSGVRGDEQPESARGPARGAARTRRRDRPRTAGVLHARRRPVLHEARTGVRRRGAPTRTSS